jgi:ZIP family zinc transporter
MDFFTAVLFGIGTALPLVLGAIVGTFWTVPRKLTAGLLAFASGSLIIALAFELFEPAVREVGIALTTVSLLAGTVVFVAAKYAVEFGSDDSGLALLAAVISDGIPENLTLGVALIGSQPAGSLAILAGIAANNFPESIGGANGMRDSGKSKLLTIGVWVASSAVLVAAVVVGYTLFSDVGQTVLALVRAFGAGSVLAAVADEIMPDAYESGGPIVAFATAAGFVFTFTLM